MKNFIHLFGPGDSPETVVVDPAWEVPEVLRVLEEDGRRLTAMVVTHAHHDHVNGLAELLAAKDVPVFAQKAEVERSELLQGLGPAVRAIEPGHTLTVGALEVRCLHTPGHTRGSQCLLGAGALFSGDTLFVNACGRCDLPGGDVRELHHSLHQVLGALPGETRLYPGHDYGDVPVSTLARERLHNPYLLRARLDEFIAHRSRPR